MEDFIEWLRIRSATDEGARALKEAIQGALSAHFDALICYDDDVGQDHPSLELLSLNGFTALSLEYFGSLGPQMPNLTFGVKAVEETEDLRQRSQRPVNLVGETQLMLEESDEILASNLGRAMLQELPLIQGRKIERAQRGTRPWQC